jgi:hypothetical protein
MMTKLETALKALKDHEETGDYLALYKALQLVIEANKREPENVSPLVRGITSAVLEPLYLQIEKYLEETRPREKGDPCNVIFVDFAKSRAA